MNKKQIELLSKANKCKSVIELVNKYYNTDCTIPTRVRSVSTPRQIAMYLIYNNLNISNEQIGRLFKSANGDFRKNAIVFHSRKKVNDLIMFDKNIREDVKELQRSVEEIAKSDDLGVESVLEKSKAIIDLNNLLIHKDLRYLNNLKKEVLKTN